MPRYKRNIVYVGVADESYWRGQQGMDLSLLTGFPISQGTYAYSIKGDFIMGFSHNPITLLGALENVLGILGEMEIKSFPQRHPFRMLEGSRDIDDTYTVDLLAKRFGRGNVALRARERPAKVI